MSDVAHPLSRLASRPGTALVRAAPPVTVAMHTTPNVWPPSTTVAEVRTVFADDHVHAVLIVEHGRLLAVLDRTDVPPDDGGMADRGPAIELGTLAGRVVYDTVDLSQAHLMLAATGRRRLAVIDARRRCLGLLCLKRDGTGFCTDEDVSARQRERGDEAPRRPTPEDLLST